MVSVALLPAEPDPGSAAPRGTTDATAAQTAIRMERSPDTSAPRLFARSRLAQSSYEPFTCRARRSRGMTSRRYTSRRSSWPVVMWAEAPGKDRESVVERIAPLEKESSIKGNDDDTYQLHSGDRPIELPRGVYCPACDLRLLALTRVRGRDIMKIGTDVVSWRGAVYRAVPVSSGQTSDERERPEAS